MKEVDNMFVTAYPEAGLWVIECSVHGLLSVTTDREVDSAQDAHLVLAHGAKVTA